MPPLYRTPGGATTEDNERRAVGLTVRRCDCPKLSALCGERRPGRYMKKKMEPRTAWTMNEAITESTRVMIALPWSWMFMLDWTAR